MKNKIAIVLSSLVAVFVFASCLKDDIGEYWKDDLAGKMYATVAKPTLQQLALKPVPGDVQYEFLVNIATDALPSEDITLTFKIDPSAVTEYNAAAGKNFKPYPNVEVLTKTLVIAKGTRNGYAKAKVWGADALNACDNFIAAITIESAKTASGKDIPVAGNMKSYLLALPISNPYAGAYHVVGYRKHPTLGTFAVDNTQELTTVDCKTVHKTQVGDYTGYTVDMEVTDETMTVGGATVYKVIVTIPETSDSGQYSDLSGAPMNYYNPATKTFELYYFYNTAAPRIIRETIVRN